MVNIDRYSCWRDTKICIVVFHRNRDFSAVLRKIEDTAAKHPNCMRQVKYEDETGFRFVFHHRDDKERELLMTILAFEVPK